MIDIDYIINGKKPKKKKTKQHKETNDPFAAVLGKNYKSKDGGPSLSNDFLSIFNGSTSKKNKSKGKSKQSQKPSAGMVNPAAAMGVGNMSGILNDKKTKKQNKLLQNTKMKSGKGHKRFSDWDKDGVINGLDCAPLNPNKHMALRVNLKKDTHPDIKKKLEDEGLDPDKTVAHGTSNESAEQIRQSGQFNKGTLVPARGRAGYEDTKNWAKTTYGDRGRVVVGEVPDKQSVFNKWTTVGRPDREGIDNIKQGPYPVKKIRTMKETDEDVLEEDDPEPASQDNDEGEDKDD